MSQNNPPTKPKHPGGRPPKDPKDKVVKCYISMTKAHHTATDGDRSGMIRRALDMYFEKQVKDIEDKILALLPENPNATATEVFVSKEDIANYLTRLKDEIQTKNPGNPNQKAKEVKGGVLSGRKVDG